MLSAVLRFDASLRIGSGHGVRSLALARSLAKSGWHVAVAASAETFETVSVPAGMGRIVLNGRSEDEAATVGEAIGSADLLVADHYGRDEEFETACRTWARRILAVDDLADRPHDCDFLLDQTIGRQERDYRPLVPAECRLLLGPDFALLREDFAALRVDSLARREHAGLERILISMGGTDPHDVAAKAVQGILASGLRVDVDVVLGASSSSALVAAAKAGGGRVRLLTHVTNMAEVMAVADLAIGAGGVTSWERCCMGLPTLIIVTADNQALIAERLAEEGAAQVLGQHAEVEAERVAEALRKMKEDTTMLNRMSAAAREICDGRGVERVIPTITGKLQ